jgi:hypothetical protein
VKSEPLQSGFIGAYCVFPLLVIGVLSDPVHDLSRRHTVGSHVVLLWAVLAVVLIGYKAKRSTMILVSLIIGGFVVWNGRLDYREVNRVAIYGVPLILVTIAMVGLVIRWVRGLVKRGRALKAS